MSQIAADQPLDALDDVPRVEAEHRQHDADQDRQQHQPAEHRQRRAAKKAVETVVPSAGSTGSKSVIRLRTNGDLDASPLW